MIKSDNYFTQCDTLETAKKLYRELLLKYHPDHNPDGEEITKKVIADFEYFINHFVESAFHKAEKDGVKWENYNATAFAGIIKLIIDWNIKG